MRVYITVLILCLTVNQANASCLGASDTNSIFAGAVTKLAATVILWAFWEGLQARALTTYQCSAEEVPYCCAYAPATNGTVNYLDRTRCVPTHQRQAPCGDGSHMFCRKTDGDFTDSVYTETTGRMVILGIMTGISMLISGAVVTNFQNTLGLNKIIGIQKAMAGNPAFASVASDDVANTIRNAANGVGP
ncbi:MAG: hypothetical protein V4534_03375 [Myxococcota bacterium]